MTHKPHPREFTYEEEFVCARMDFAARALDAASPFDSFDAATKKRAAIAQAREDAREEAIDVWADWVERCVEDYERGVGPGWD